MKMLLLLALLLPACAQTIGELDCHPNVLLQKSPQSLSLRVEQGVPETLHLDASNPWLAADVDHWHETLSRGFHAAFDPYFGKEPGATLAIVVAQPQLYELPREATMSIRYQAELRDAGGVVKQRFAGTAASPEPISQVAGNASSAFSHAVEVLYEQIAQQLK